jgi:hypothetical protein
LDVNIDPNNPTVVSPNLILPVAQHYTAGYMHGDRRANHLGNMLMYNWSESFGYSWYDDEFAYLVTTTFYSNLFDLAYTNPLKQYELLTKLDATYNNYVAIGKIMKAYHYQLLVDFYGDVPYSEALGRSQNATPKYDKAEVIYVDLIVELTEAIALINEAAEVTTSVVPGADDAIFDGDMIQWKRFANSVKLRILTRQSSLASKQAYITTELAAIAAEGSGYITSDVVVNPGYINEENRQNPYYAAFGKDPSGTATLTSNATCASQYILDLLVASNDPRIDRLYERPATGHLGVDQGLEPGPEYAFQFVSNIGPAHLVASTQGSKIYTLAESKFNLAELALKNFGGDAEALYYEGIAASFAGLGNTSAQYDAYVAQNLENVNYATSTDKLEAIITQKWLSVNGITAEQSWFDYSRTGFPANLPISEQATGSADRPVRLFYPASERSSNAANVPTPQPDAFAAKLFWAN